MRSALFDSSWGPLAVALAVGCLMLVAALVALARPRGAWLRSRLEPFTPAGAGGGGGGIALGADPLRPRLRQLSEAAERSAGEHRTWRWMARLLERAGLRTTPFEVGAVSIGLGVAGGVVTYLLSESTILAIAAGALAAYVPTAWITTRARHRMQLLEDQLPDVLMTMAGSLRVGQSFNHSMQAIVDEGLAPTSEEFSRVLAETRLGSPMDDALERMAVRVGSDDLRFVLMSVTIQREIGGSLADLFQTISDTVRQRQQFRRRVHALTAMGRASAYVLLALPFVTAGLITLVHPGYLKPLFTTTVGQIMVVVLAAMMILGAFVLRKIATVKG